LLIAEFPQPTSRTSNTVDKFNKSMLSGLANVFTLVLLLQQWTMVRLINGGGGGGGGSNGSGGGGQ
jgi:hypothetical protein